MAHVNRLTVIRVQRLKVPGMYPDGAGLYLQVTGDGSGKSWLFRFSLRGRCREMGLGSFAKVSLAEARAKASDYHKLIDSGVDPIEWRKQQRAKAALAQTGSITFGEAARQHIASHRQGLRNLKYATQYGTTIATYVEPVLGKLLVRDVDTALVMRVLEPIWTARPSTANKLRGRIERILDWAKVQGYRHGENPARWRGHLDKLLLPKSRLHITKHHAALPYAELPEFMQKLREQTGTAARALEFLILTACRSGELLKAGRGEVNYSEGLWIMPAEHTKTGQEHRVPLCARALELIDMNADGLLFPIGKGAMQDLLIRIGYAGRSTPHGFRSTFRDWAGDRTTFAREIAEAALAHSVGNEVERAYRRGDAFDKRRRLMEAWADYCASVPAPASDKVVSMRSA
jgi:integrase